MSTNQMTAADKKELFKARFTRLSQAFAHEVPDRVPIAPIVESWAGHYAGHDLVQLAYDYPKLRESFVKVAMDFPEIDALPPVGPVRPGNLYAVAASKEFSHYNEMGEAAASVQHVEVPGALRPEEYGEFIADPFKFFVEKQIPRRYGAFQRAGEAKTLAASQVMLTYRRYLDGALGATRMGLAEECGMPTLLKGGGKIPLDLLMDYCRGFVGMMTDIRRHPDDVIAACEALAPLLERRALHGVPPGRFPGLFFPLHIPAFLKPKDFEKFYFPTFRQMIELCAAHDTTPLVFFEGNWEPYYDYLNELPKHRVVGLIEGGNFKQHKNAIGDTITLMGGLSVDDLKHSTKDEIVYRTRQLIEDVAPGGGWIFSFDKALLAPNDVNLDNFRVVLETVEKYGAYDPAERSPVPEFPSTPPAPIQLPMVKSELLWTWEKHIEENPGLVNSPSIVQQNYEQGLDETWNAYMYLATQ